MPDNPHLRSEVLFPEIDPYAAGGLKVDARHTLHWETCGNMAGVPLIFLHGGSHRQMLLGWHHSPYYNKAYGMNQYLASRGYVVLSINYRAGIGYGMEFREAQNIGAAGASEFNDVLGAGLYLRSNTPTDNRRSSFRRPPALRSRSSIRR